MRMPVDRKKLLLADDQATFLDGLELLLEADYEIVGKVSNGQDLVELAKLHDPDVIVTNATMSNLSGVETVAALRVAEVRAKVVVMTGQEDTENAAEAIGDGIDGFVLKRAANTELPKAVSEALAGRCWISPDLKLRIIRRVQGGTVKPESEEDVVASMSERQRDIVRKVVAGKFAKEIAVELGISRKSVEYQKYKLMKRLDLSNLADLIRFAMRHDMVD